MQVNFSRICESAIPWSLYVDEILGSFIARRNISCVYDTTHRFMNLPEPSFLKLRKNLNSTIGPTKSGILHCESNMKPPWDNAPEAVSTSQGTSYRNKSRRSEIGVYKSNSSWASTAMLPRDQPNVNAVYMYFDTRSSCGLETLWSNDKNFIGYLILENIHKEFHYQHNNLIRYKMDGRTHDFRRHLFRRRFVKPDSAWRHKNIERHTARIVNTFTTLK